MLNNERGIRYKLLEPHLQKKYDLLIKQLKPSLQEGETKINEEISSEMANIRNNFESQLQYLPSHHHQLLNEQYRLSLQQQEQTRQQRQEELKLTLEQFGSRQIEEFKKQKISEIETSLQELASKVQYEQNGKLSMLNTLHVSHQNKQAEITSLGMQHSYLREELVKNRLLSDNQQQQLLQLDKDLQQLDKDLQQLQQQLQQQQQPPTLASTTTLTFDNNSINNPRMNQTNSHQPPYRRRFFPK